MKRAVFFTVKYTVDDDEHPGYLPGVEQAVRALHESGTLTIAVHHSPGTHESVMHHIARMLKRELGVDYFAFCAHESGEKCLCAKPSPMLILRAAKAMNVDLPQSFFVGASYDDVSMARASGINNVHFIVPNTGGFSDVVEGVILPTVRATPPPRKL